MHVSATTPPASGIGAVATKFQQLASTLDVVREFQMDSAEHAKTAVPILEQIKCQAAEGVEQLATFTPTVDAAAIENFADIQRRAKAGVDRLGKSIQFASEGALNAAIQRQELDGAIMNFERVYYALEEQFGL